MSVYLILHVLADVSHPAVLEFLPQVPWQVEEEGEEEKDGGDPLVEPMVDLVVLLRPVDAHPGMGLHSVA